MDVLQAKDYSSRKALETYISQTYGTDVKSNRDAAVIEGTKAELARLGLSERAAIFGIKCQLVEEPAQ